MTNGIVWLQTVPETIVGYNVASVESMTQNWFERYYAARCPTYAFSVSGVFRDPKATKESYLKQIEEIIGEKLDVIHQYYQEINESLGTNNICFTTSWNTNLFQPKPNFSRDTNSFTFSTINKDIHNKLSDFLNKSLKPITKKSCVYTVIESSSGLDVRSIGEIHSPLNQMNYNEHVIQAYDHILDDLKSPEPCGRLILIRGKPGTGKTYLIRSLVSAEAKGAYILVPSQLVPQLANPSFANLLINLKDDWVEEGEPIILILEDADDAVVTRATDNISAVSSLLNLTDGIFGSALNIRVIATTNAQKKEIDPAISRKGRLCKEVEIEELSLEKTQALWLHLEKDAKNLPRKPMTLADIYLG